MDEGRRKKNIERAGRLTTAMDDLLREMPASKVGQVVFLWPQIELALERGHKPKFIWTKLQSAGLKMSLAEFRVYVGRARKRAKKHPQTGQKESFSTKAVTVETRGPGVVSEDVAPANQGGGLDGGANPDLDQNALDALQLLKKKGPQWPGTPKKVKDLL